MEAQPSHIVQRKANACLLEPNFPYDVIEELHDRNAAIRVGLKQLGKHTSCEERPDTQFDQNELIPICSISHLHLGPASEATFKKSS